jgi:polygalacturonase
MRWINRNRRWPNNDGIDIVSSKNVLIHNTHISTGDDAIDLSTHVVGYTTSNVTVSSCKLSSTSARMQVTFISTKRLIVRNVCCGLHH